MIYLGFALALLGGAMAAGLGAMGSSIGCGVAGETASGVLAEDDEKFGSIIVLQALPGTQGIYGFVTAFLVLVKLNVFGGVSDAVLHMDWTMGLAIFGACIPSALGNLLSGMWQGKVSAAAMGVVAKNPKAFGKSIILPAVVETFALFALVETILILMLAIPVIK